MYNILEQVDDLYFKCVVHFGNPVYLYLGQETYKDFDEYCLRYLLTPGLYSTENLHVKTYRGLEVIKVEKDWFISFGFDFDE